MTQYNFCSKCGALLKAGEQFCSNCGTRIGGAENDGQRETSTDGSRPGATGMFPRMLAYIPGLFWVPLAIDSRDRNNRECANQGLLMLLYCIIGSILFSIAGGILAYVSIRSTAASVYSQSALSYQYSYQYPSTYPGIGFDEFGARFNQFGEMFRPASGITVSNSILGILISLLHLLYTIYIPMNIIWRIIHCINYPEPHILPFIGKIKIIKQ